jgi:hypothetical protein
MGFGRSRAHPRPAKSADTATESGKPLAKSPGVKLLRMEDDRAVLEVEAGSYRFAVRQ